MITDLELKLEGAETIFLGARSQLRAIAETPTSVRCKNVHELTADIVKQATLMQDALGIYTTLAEQSRS